MEVYSILFIRNRLCSADVPLSPLNPVTSISLYTSFYFDIGSLASFQIYNCGFRNGDLMMSLLLMYHKYKCLQRRGTICLITKSTICWND